MGIYCLKKRPEVEAVQYNGVADIAAIKDISGFDEVSLRSGVLKLFNVDVMAHELNPSDWLVKPLNGSLPFVIADDDFKRDYQGVSPKKVVDSDYEIEFKFDTESGNFTLNLSAHWIVWLFVGAFASILL